MQLQYLFASCGGMQPVDILRQDGIELTLLLPFRELFVRGIRLCVVAEQLVAVEAVEFPGVPQEEAVAEDRLRRIVVFLVVEAVHAPEIGDAAFR